MSSDSSGNGTDTNTAPASGDRPQQADSDGQGGADSPAGAGSRPGSDSHPDNVPDASAGAPNAAHTSPPARRAGGQTENQSMPESRPPSDDVARPAGAPKGSAKRPRPASVPDGMLTVEDHLEIILRGIGPLEPYEQPLVEALGLPLVEDIIAEHDIPRFDNSAMDGYAVRADDVSGASSRSPVVLPVVGEIAAGSGRPFAISSGTAVKIMTGAPMPRGADAIVPYELTDQGNARVTISESVSVGNAVRRSAEDVAAGTKVLDSGTLIGPREVGLMATLGVGRIAARPRPRVVIMSTGDELREPGQRLDYDSIFDGNSHMLAAAARKAGAIAYRVGGVPDNARDFRKVLSEQLVRADLVVTTGGISKGDFDVVKEALSSMETMRFHQVAVQPGKPQGFGTIFEQQTPLIALPGNAVSAYVSFEIFVLPAIRRLMGITPYRRPMVHAVLASDITKRAGRRQYVRAFFEVTHRGAKVTPVGGAGSHEVGGLSQANALIVFGEDATAMNMGDTVRTLVLDRDF